MWEEYNTDSPGGSYFKAALALRVGRGDSMPTDMLRATEQRIAAEKRNAANLLAILVLVPTIMCLVSILLSAESYAFECALTATFLE
jgi:hypothetical protein